jgi:hypothetical protein
MNTTLPGLTLSLLIIVSEKKGAQFNRPESGVGASSSSRMLG